MEKINNVMIGIEGKTGAMIDEKAPGAGVALGVVALKTLGDHFVAQTGLEGGYFHPATTHLHGKGPLGAFLGVGVYKLFDDMSFMATVNARSGYDFSRDKPFAGAELGMRLMFELAGKDGIVNCYPFIGMEGGYLWDDQHGGRALLTFGFMYDVAR